MNEFTLYVRPDDWVIGMKIALRRSHDVHVAAAMRSFLRPGGTFIDIGANVGYMTLLGASLVGPSGKVLAFEALPTNVEMIRKSLRANRNSNVTLYPYAVAERHASVVIAANEGNSHFAGRDDPRRDLVTIEAVDLDTFIGDAADGMTIDLIKMDIEGAEGLALQGMKRLLARSRPVIIAEFMPSALQRISGLSPEAFIGALQESGYDLSALVFGKENERVPVADGPGALQVLKASGQDMLDLLAIPRVTS